jgi:hypothetical protein
MNKYYVTLDVGQPHYPGYFISEGEDHIEARISASFALDNQWYVLYYELDEVPLEDRIYRGTISNRTILSLAE